MRQKQFLFKSLAAHLAVFAIYQFGCPRARVESAPLGITVQVLSGQELDAPAALPKSKPVKIRTVSAAPVAESAAPQIGNAEAPLAPAVQETGPVGVAGGLEASAKERYLYELRLLLDSRKQYPPLARSLRQEGIVEVGFLLQPDGRLSETNVVRPSTHANLNRAALQLIEAVGRFKPLPAELGKMSGWRVSVPIEYRLQ